MCWDRRCSGARVVCVCVCDSDGEDVGKERLEGGREVKGEKGDR